MPNPLPPIENELVGGVVPGGGGILLLPYPDRDDSRSLDMAEYRDVSLESAFAYGSLAPADEYGRLGSPAGRLSKPLSASS